MDLDCPKRSKSDEEVALEVPCLPDDSLVDILSHLPAKPLFRFKCVSKGWCSLIADRLGCRKSPQTLEGFFAGEAPESYGVLLGPPRPVPLVNTCFSFLTKSPEVDKIVLVGSCNGLLLFRHRRVVSEDGTYESEGYIVCNPATEEWVSVPSSGWKPSDYDSEDEDGGNEDCHLDTYLIFDPAISPHFQLIELKMKFTDAHEVHTFSSVTGAWRLQIVAQLEPDPTILGSGYFVGCSFNGKLHVRANQDQDLHPVPEQDRNMIFAFDREQDRNMIFAFDGEGRPFRTLHWPKKDRGFIVFTGQSQGHLHCISGCLRKPSHMTELSIWVLEDYNAEKWVLRDNVSLSHLFGRMSSSWYMQWEVVGIHPLHGLVFFADYRNHMLISYDMDNKEVRDLCSLHGYHRPIIPYVPYFAQSAAFTKKHRN